MYYSLRFCHLDVTAIHRLGKSSIKGDEFSFFYEKGNNNK